MESEESKKGERPSNLERRNVFLLEPFGMHSFPGLRSQACEALPQARALCFNANDGSSPSVLICFKVDLSVGAMREADTKATVRLSLQTLAQSPRNQKTTTKGKDKRQEQEQA